MEVAYLNAELKTPDHQIRYNTCIIQVDLAKFVYTLFCQKLMFTLDIKKLLS